MRRMITLSTFVLFIFCILLAPRAQAQQEEDWCYTMKMYKHLKKLDPTLETRVQQYEEKLKFRLNAAKMKREKGVESLGKKPTKPTPTPPPPTSISITIPVVVHILYNTPEENVSEARVLEQIELTNRDYAALNMHSMQAFPSTLKADTKIQFCLAQKKLDGSPTNGIERRYTTKSEIDVTSVKEYSAGGLDAWDPSVYFNIWVCDMESGILGMGWFPTWSIGKYYGAIVDYTSVASADTNWYGGQGKIATHEIGHCLNLYHIWGDDDGACNGTDYCDDTPNQANTGLTLSSWTGAVTDACTTTYPGVMYMNFMDYMYGKVTANFTPDQVLRMQDCFATSSSPLYSLRFSDACSAPDDCEPPTMLSVPNPTRTTATLTWTAMHHNVGGYYVRHRKVGSPNWDNYSPGTNSLFISGLTKNTSYEFQVQNLCDTYGNSDWSDLCVYKTSKTLNPKTKWSDDPSLPATLTVYPNPTKGDLTISYRVTEPGPVTINVVNTLGAVIARFEEYGDDTGTFMLPFDAQDCIPGLYFVVVSSASGTETTKFVVER
ncbi:T9SS type A sorting domain-containing protein [bacterium]|nr:T9SS type A sorting domain-containing protein [bacterium]